MKQKDSLKTTLAILLVLLVLFVFYTASIETVTPDVPDIEDFKPSTAALSSFSSCTQLENAIEEKGGYGYGRYGDIEYMIDAMPTAGQSAPKSANEFSTTNVQVQGVDEADIVKTDGTHIYTLSGDWNNKALIITKAYPAETAKVLSRIEYNEFNPNEMFIHGNKLIVFGRENPNEPVFAQGMLIPEHYYASLTTVHIYDISNKENPIQIKKYSFDGDYITARKVGDNAYFVVNSYPYEDIVVPLFAEDNGPLEKSVGCSEIYYFDDYQTVNYVTLISIDLENLKTEKQTIVGSGENIYASLENLYVAELHYNYNENNYGTSEQRTQIYKFSLDGEIKYQKRTSVPGTILNQFSMDEHEDHFRIATTKGQVWRDDSDSINNIYILDSNLNLAGKIEGIAPGETIYSARFIGDKGYLVTFKKVDPFFVLDLSDPKNPEVLGYLKIPGYSDYLHPYDENHIIGIGKDTVEAEEGNFAWYQGLKIAIFDVTDVSNPTEMHKIIIGDRGTHSEALNDHKAFLFDLERNLLVIPVEITVIQDKEGVEPNSYGETVFNGAQVYDISLENGFQLKGQVTHYSGTDFYGQWGSDIRRSLYINNVLYTVSENKIKANTLFDLSEINTINLEKTSCTTTTDQSIEDCCEDWAKDTGYLKTWCGASWEIRNGECHWKCTDLID